MHDRHIDQVVEHDHGRGNRHENPHIEAECHEWLLLPHEARCDQRLTQPRAFPPHLLPQKHLVRAWDNRHTDGRVLICCAVVAQDKIRHTAVVAERRLLPEKPLIEPCIHVLQHEIAAVARERTRETSRCVEIALRRLHDAEGDGIAHRLHFGQGVGVGIRDIRTP